MQVQKYGAIAPVTREELLAAGAVEPTADERVEMDRAATLQRRYEKRLNAWSKAARKIDEPIARAVLDIHYQSETGQCLTCDYWPCETAVAVMEKMGHPEPRWSD